LITQGFETLLELGPRPLLTKMVKPYYQQAGIAWLASLEKGLDDWQVMLGSLSELYVRGVNVDWTGFDRDYNRRKLALPTYPFDRKRYWMVFRKRNRRTAMNAKASPVPAAQTEAESTPPLARQQRIVSKLCDLVAGLLEADPARIDISTPLLEMGADSIVL